MIKVSLRSKKARDAARRDAVVLTQAARLFEIYSTHGLERRDVIPALDSLAEEIMAAVDKEEK
ncbi:hypothetical protein [Nocardia jiangxiensis]|uniref:hypothetical protein n=1 Tax=Nocardia jiangxiensis TaxID=282685 RepID=UPI0002F33B7E|nr:hypothetical protein [Nocardia jiangxiensis]